MQIWIKNLNTGDSKSLEVEPTTTVEQLMELIARDIYSKKYLLQFIAKNILDNPKATLQELQIEDDFTLNLLPADSSYPTEPVVNTVEKKAEESKAIKYGTNEQATLLAVPSNQVDVRDITKDNGGIVVFGNCRNAGCRMHS